MNTDLKKFQLTKYVFYTEGPSDEDRKSKPDWALPPRGRIIKTEIERYLEADEQLIEMGLRIAYQAEKVAFVESIIDSLNRRSFQIKSAIDFIRWSHGG
jgi:hypothetical protein